MSTLSPIVLVAFLPLALLLFAVLPGRRAMMATYLIAWLFLPMGGFNLPGLPEYSKVSAAAIACVVGTVLFHSGVLLRLRPGLIDVPMGVYLLGPVLTNTLGGGAGVYEGLAMSLGEVVLWGVPWLMGRLYFTDLPAVRELAVAVVIGGLVYVPLCLIEVRFSPQIHRWVYGYHQHAFNQTRRLGGWRPMVLMQHGLALGMWMTAATLVAVWMWRAKVMPKFLGLSAGFWTGVLALTTVLCKSAAALGLLGVGLAGLWASKRLRSRWPVAVLVLLTPAYIGLRVVGGGDALIGSAISVAQSVLGAERAASLQTRIRSEQLIADRAMQRPLLGWGGRGRYLVHDPDDPSRLLSVPDQFWVIAFGKGGLLSLGSVCAVLLWPAWIFLRTCPPRDWLLPGIAPVAALAVVPVLFMLDCLLNAMMNPIFTLSAAAVATVTMEARRAARAVGAGAVVAVGSPLVAARGSISGVS